MSRVSVALSRHVGCILTLLLVSTGALADRFYLKSGGEIEAQLLETTDTHYRIRTFVGRIQLSIEDVERFDSGPSVFDEYDQRLAQLKESNAVPTPDALFDLAQWCKTAGLRRECDEHLEQALQLDPDHAPTRQAMGYTKIGPLWVETKTILESEATRQRAAQAEQREQERARAAELASMENDIHRIEARYFVGQARQKADGFAQLQRMALRSRLALEAMFNAYRETRRELTRFMLIDLFVENPTAQTTQYLVTVATEDELLDLRHEATEELLKRDVTDVLPLLTAALDNDSAQIRDLAAAVLARIDNDAAIPALIDKLVGSREMYVKHLIVTNRNRYLKVNDTEDTGNAGNENSAKNSNLRKYQAINNSRYNPFLDWSNLDESGLNGLKFMYGSQYRYETVPVYHSEVRAALVKLTEQDFGFDQAAWKRWLKKSQRQATLQNQTATPQTTPPAPATQSPQAAPVQSSQP